MCESENCPALTFPMLMQARLMSEVVKLIDDGMGISHALHLTGRGQNIVFS